VYVMRHQPEALTRRVRVRFVQYIVARRRAHDQPATVEMEIGANRIVGRYDPERERGAARAGYRPLGGARRARRRRTEPGFSHALSAELGEAGPAGTFPHRRIELVGGLADRLGAKQCRIDRQHQAAFLRKASSIELSAFQLLISGITVSANM